MSLFGIWQEQGSLIIKNISTLKVKVVVNGVVSLAIDVLKFLMLVGVKDAIFYYSKGIIYEGR